MAISLADIQQSNQAKPPRVVVHGTPGIGKSTFAASAPSPIFIQTEDGLGTLQVASFPLARSYQDVLEALSALYAEKHEYQTVVIDSLSALEELIWRQVARDHNKNNIEEIGYGKGYIIALDYWTQVINGVNALRDKGLLPILIAHTEIIRYDSPEVEPYDRYQINLHKRTFQFLHEKADVIGFANWETFVASTEVGFNQRCAVVPAPVGACSI